MTAEVQLKLKLVRNLKATERSVPTALWSRGFIDKIIKAFLPLFLLVGEGCTKLMLLELWWFVFWEFYC